MNPNIIYFDKSSRRLRALELRGLNVLYEDIDASTRTTVLMSPDVVSIYPSKRHATRV